MGFFKPLTTAASNKAVARLQVLIWVLIYAGLLTLVLGLSVQRLDAATGWLLVAGGAALTNQSPEPSALTLSMEKLSHDPNAAATV